MTNWWPIFLLSICGLLISQLIRCGRVFSIQQSKLLTTKIGCCNHRLGFSRSAASVTAIITLLLINITSYSSIFLSFLISILISCVAGAASQKQRLPIRATDLTSLMEVHVFKLVRQFSKYRFATCLGHDLVCLFSNDQK